MDIATDRTTGCEPPGISPCRERYRSGWRSSSTGHGSLAPLTKRTTIDNHRDDPLYPRIRKAVAQILASGKFVAPVDVLVRMELLRPKQLEDWRHGRVPYLERVILGNLSRLSRILRILRLHAHDLNLKPSSTVYMRWGKGPKQRLRFTKTGDKNLEARSMECGALGQGGAVD